MRITLASKAASLTDTVGERTALGRKRNSGSKILRSARKDTKKNSVGVLSLSRRLITCSVKKSKLQRESGEGNQVSK